MEVKTRDSMRNYIELLKAEGMTDEQISWDEDFQYEDENGFFSWRIEHGYPYMTHFYVYKDKRNLTNGVRLYRKFTDTIIKEGYAHFIAEVVPEFAGKTFGIFIRKRLKCKEPYAKVGNNEYYLIGVKK